MNPVTSLVSDVQAADPVALEMKAAQAAGAVMKALADGFGWTSEAPVIEHRYARLTCKVPGHPGGDIYWSFGGYPNSGRIVIAASTPHDTSLYRYGEERHEITVSPTRAQSDLAKDIERRFLPRFIELADKADAIQKQQEAYQRQMRECLERLKGSPLDEQELARAKFYLSVDGAWGDVYYSSENEVKFDLHNVPEGKAEHILRILRGSTAAKGGRHER
jgi:hypothetical protein